MRGLRTRHGQKVIIRDTAYASMRSELVVSAFSNSRLPQANTKKLVSTTSVLLEVSYSTVRVRGGRNFASLLPRSFQASPFVHVVCSHCSRFALVVQLSEQCSSHVPQQLGFLNIAECRHDCIFCIVDKLALVLLPCLRLSVPSALNETVRCH